MRGTTKSAYMKPSEYAEISTHVPHAGHDSGTRFFSLLNVYISTHVPHAGHDSFALWE